LGSRGCRIYSIAKRETGNPRDSKLHTDNEKYILFVQDNRGEDFWDGIWGFVFGGFLGVVEYILFYCENISLIIFVFLFDCFCEKSEK